MDNLLLIPTSELVKYLNQCDLRAIMQVSKLFYQKFQESQNEIKLFLEKKADKISIKIHEGDSRFFTVGFKRDGRDEIIVRKKRKGVPIALAANTIEMFLEENIPIKQSTVVSYEGRISSSEFDIIENKIIYPFETFIIHRKFLDNFRIITSSSLYLLGDFSPYYFAMKNSYYAFVIPLSRLYFYRGRCGIGFLEICYDKFRYRMDCPQAGITYCSPPDKIVLVMCGYKLKDIHLPPGTEIKKLIYNL